MRMRNLVALCTLSVTLSILGIVWSEPTILDAAPGFTNVARPVNLASPAFTGTATAENLNVSGNVGITGTLGVTGAASFKGAATFAPSSGVPITVTGVSGTTGMVITGPSGGQSLSISGPPIGAFNALNITDGNGTTTAARFGILVNNWANTIGGAAAKFVAIGANGNGVTATCSGGGNAGSFTATGTGYALEVVGDTTSPSKGSIKLTPLDANPTSCAVGDIYVTTAGVLKVCTATTPTWVNVGSQ